MTAKWRELDGVRVIEAERYLSLARYGIGSVFNIGTRWTAS
jgi:hypothetical protein